MFTRVLTLMALMLMVLAGPMKADDKNKRDRDAAASLALEIALKKTAPTAVAESPGATGVKIIVGYCVGERCFIIKELSPDATDKEQQAAFDAAVLKAKKATNSDADDPLDAWSITADVDPETGGMFIGTGSSPQGFTRLCDENGCTLVPLQAMKAERPPNCTCGETCPCVAMLPPMSAGNPMTMFASSSYATIADRPRLFRGGFRPVRAVGRLLFWRR